MSPLFLCHFELRTEVPQVIMEAMHADDQENSDAIEYSALCDRLVVKVRSECFKPLIKTAIFFMERFKLSSDTIALCKDDQKSAECAEKSVSQQAPANAIR